MTRNLNKKPEFFCVGAAKCGTSALQYFLRQHPRIFMPELKEIHHFAGDLLRSDDYWLDREKYFSLFNDAGNGQIVGETSVFYLLSEESARNIKEYYSSAKIIIMIRNPIEVMYSLHSQLVYNGEENIVDFIKALKFEEDRKSGRNMPDNTRIQKKHWYTHVVQFSEQIRRYQNYFPDQNIHYIIHDDFKTDTIKEVKKVYKFLGVSENFVPKLKIINPNKVIRSRHLQELKNRFVHNAISRFLHSDNLRKLDAFLTRLNTRYIERKSLDQSIERQLKEQLKSEIDDLGNLLGRDLSHWHRQ